MTMRDLDIQIDIDVDESGITKATSEIERLINEANKLDERFTINVGSNIDEAIRELQQLDARLSAIDKRIKVDVSADTASAIADLQQLEAAADNIDMKVDIDTNVASAIADLQQLEAAAKAINVKVDIDLDAASIHAQLDAIDQRTIYIDVDTSVAHIQISSLEAHIQALDSMTIHMDIDTAAATAQIAAVQAQVAALQAQLNNLGNSNNPIIINNHNNGPPPTVDVNVQATEAIAELQRLEQRVQSLDDTDIFFNVDLEDASSEVLRLRTLLRTLEQDINLNVDTSAAHAQIAALQAHLLTLMNPPDISPSGGGGGFFSNLFSSFSSLGGNPFMGMITSAITTAIKISVLVTVLQSLAAVAVVAVGAIGTLGVAIGLLGSGALALVGSLGVGLLGIGGAAAMVVPNIMKLYDENAKLNDLQKETKTHIDSLKNAWGRFVDGNQATALDLTTHGVNVLKTALTQLEPVMTAGANAVDILFHNLDAALQGNQMTAFFDSMKRQIPQMTEWIGNGIGNIARGAANLMTAFEPLTMWAGEGFANMMQRFSNWSFNLQGSEKLTSFIDYVKTNLPTLGSGLGNAATGVAKFFAAFGDTASTGIQWFADKMKEFDSWASNLGSNTGFQDMLSDIERLAPKVGEAIGMISDAVMSLTDHLANGGGMDKMLSFLEGVQRTVNGENFLGNLLFNDKIHDVQAPKNMNPLAMAYRGAKNFLFGEKGGSTLADRGIDLKVNTSNIASDITNATKGPFDVGAQVNELKPPMMINPLEIPAQVNELKPPMMVDPIDVMARATEVNVEAAQTGPINIPATVDKIETPTALPSLALAGRVNQIEPPPTGTLPVAEMTGRVQQIQPPTAGSLPVAEMTGRVNQVEAPPTLPTMELQAKVNKIEPPPMGAVSLPVKASSVDTTGIPPVRMPLSLSGTNPLSNFNWPPLPSFTFPPLPSFNWPPMPTFNWPPLPKWSWPPMPKFNWPPFPKFSWPPMPTVKVSVSGGGNVPGFSSGLGKVDRDMHAIVHKNEAILPAHQAQTLRNMGVIEGDGRYPTLNTSPLGGYAPVDSSSMEATSSGGSMTTNNNNFSVTVNVNGSGDAKETAINVREEIEAYFASLHDVFDPRLES